MTELSRRQGRVGARRAGSMKATVKDLNIAAAWLEEQGGRGGGYEDEEACGRVADYLRFVADQREEYEATRRSPEQRMEALKIAFEKVWGARGHRSYSRQR